VLQLTRDIEDIERWDEGQVDGEGRKPVREVDSSGRRRVAVLRWGEKGGEGLVLVDAKGRALYVDAHDRLAHLDCTGNCTKAWPPLLLARGVKGAVAGPG
jgi:hypothetical protein